MYPCRLDANTTHVCVQYLHFTMPHGSEEGGTVASAADGGGAGRSVFDGRDTVLEEGDGAEVGPLLPLEAVVQFEEVALSAGDTRYRGLYLITESIALTVILLVAIEII